jgi:hypothetical protein
MIAVVISFALFAKFTAAGPALAAENGARLSFAGIVPVLTEDGSDFQDNAVFLETDAGMIRCNS